MLSRTCRLLTAGLLVLAPIVLQAMSVIPPTFDELVAASDYVVRGVVKEVRCVTVDTPQGVAIRTLVTLQVERTLKGSPGNEVTLTLLGGKVGRRTLTVVGMPTFQVGDREIVFVAKNGRTICPLVAAGHGRYHVRHDPATKRDYVARDNGTPLASTSEITEPLEPTPTTQRLAALSEPLTPDGFEARISAAVRASQPQVQP